MARQENDVANAVRLVVDQRGGYLWRNSVGFDEIKKVRYGLKAGSADFIGIWPMKITPEMVGQTVGVFLSVETKSKDGTSFKDQKDWRDDINSYGGIAVIAKRPEDIPPAPEAVFAARLKTKTTENS